MVGAGDVLRLKVAHDHAFVVHDMVDLGHRQHGGIRHVQAFASLFAGIQEATAQKIPEAGVIPSGVEIAHQHVEIVIALQLGQRVETAIPQSLVPGARREGMNRAEPHLRAGEVDGRRWNAA